jgi:lipopolysaccharide transport protein LptA
MGPVLALPTSLAFALTLASAEPSAAPATSVRDRVTTDQRPVEMTASGGLSIDLKRQVGIAKGDVSIKRDDVHVCCDEAEASYAANRIERVTCRGRVVIVRPDGTRATAALAVFNATEDTVTLTGEARVVTEGADLAGERIIYDIAKDKLEVEGGKSRFRYKPKAELVAEIPERPCGPRPAKVAPKPAKAAKDR